MEARVKSSLEKVRGQNEGIGKNKLPHNNKRTMYLLTKTAFSEFSNLFVTSKMVYSTATKGKFGKIVHNDN
jgi:hypothetical protein